MPQCCKAEKFDGWCSNLNTVYTDETTGESYCLFHTPKGKKGMPLEEFNAEVFKRIDEIREKQKENPELICDFEETVFEGDIDFSKYDENKPLRNVQFQNAHFKGEADFFGVSFYRRTEFRCAQFEGITDFRGAHFKGRTNFWKVQFKGETVGFGQGRILGKDDIYGERAWFHAFFKGKTDFSEAQFKRETNFVSVDFNGETDFREARFEGETNFGGASFKGKTDFRKAHFIGETSFKKAFFKGKIRFCDAYLNNALFRDSYLKDVNFQYAIVSGNTLIDDDCIIDRKADFTGVGLDSARIGPKIKQLLKYNVRRLGWEKKYKESFLKTLPWRLFWWISNYGMATSRIIYAFFALALLFSIIYFAAGLIDYSQGTVINPGIINNLFHNGLDDKGCLLPFVMSDHNKIVVFFRAIYFSVVTMTTLGFGDMHARPDSIAGYISLTIQVLIGYVLLGALITRLTILFTQDGPPARFLDEKSIGERFHEAAKKVRSDILEYRFILFSNNAPKEGQFYRQKYG